MSETKRQVALEAEAAWPPSWRSTAGRYGPASRRDIEKALRVVREATP